ncbi:MAG: hypothetical protein HFJ35_06075 [Clostridia bacterium]|nr:hypothetical protein [Clostridia bacterium]
MYTNECLYKDIYTIIEMMDNEMKSKISNKFINFLLENQDINFEGTINKNIPIKEQDLRIEIKLMLSQMYIDYFCEEEKKKEILEIEKKNIENFYSKDIFKKSYSEAVNLKQTNLEGIKIEESNVNNGLSMIEYKENIFIKIINIIKQFFRK